MNKKSFHHGDLRNALVALALSELEKVGSEQLSLRELAKLLGVSKAAPYRHFENKEALLRTLAGIGVKELGDAYHQVTIAEKGAVGRLRVACKAYIDFSTAKPELYRLIFSGDLDWQTINQHEAEGETGEDSFSHAENSFNRFENLVSDAIATDDAKTVRHVTLLVWSMIHGCAKLKMDGILSVFTDIAEFEAVLYSVASNAKVFDLSSCE